MTGSKRRSSDEGVVSISPGRVDLAKTRGPLPAPFMRTAFGPQAPFITSTAARSGDSLESETGFGYRVKGAFTGAIRTGRAFSKRPWRSFFLDELYWQIN